MLSTTKSHLKQRGGFLLAFVCVLAVPLQKFDSASIPEITDSDKQQKVQNPICTLKITINPGRKLAQW